MGESEKEPLRPKEFYRERIIEMVKKINNVIDLEMIYGMTISAYKDAKTPGEI